MKLSFEWLIDLVPLSVSPGAAADRLTMSGLETLAAEAEGEHVFETEVTSNRGDLLSHLGVAQELAALYGRKVKVPPCPAARRKPRAALSKEKIAVQIKDKHRCLYYSCVVLEGLRDQPSPPFMQKRLTACGLRPINLVVDVTNYVLLEMGQPLHAFDLDRLDGRDIIVRTAKPGERFHAINGTTYELNGKDLVIADGSHPVALGGVMGGRESEVGPKTKRILLESAYFQPQTVRTTSRRLALTSDSSYRFERSVDPLGVDRARDRAVYLLETYGKVEKVSNVFKSGRVNGRRAPIRFSHTQMEKILGTAIPPAKARRILTHLGLTVRRRGKRDWQVTPSSARPDLTRPIDLVEEVARLHGYDRIRESLPSSETRFEKENPLLSLEEKAKALLVGAGFFEAVTFSLENEALLERLGFLDRASVVITNPQNKELTVMRPTLLTGMGRALAVNVNAGRKIIRLFEVASTYGVEKGSALPDEDVHVAALMSGAANESWLGADRPLGFFDLKGTCERLLTFLGVRNVSFIKSRHPFFQDGEAVTVHADELPVGILGTMSRDALETFGVKEKAWALELNLTPLTSYDIVVPLYEPPARFPSAKRDMALLVDVSVACETVGTVIRSAGGPLLRSVRLFDVFEGGSIPKGKRSLAFSIEYGASDRTLTSDRVNQLHEKIGAELVQSLNVQIR